MEKSPEITELAKALSKFQGEMDKISKDAKNPFFKSTYATLANIIRSTRDPLTKNGLSYSQFPTGEAGLTTILMHTSGQWMSDTFQMKPVDSKPQSFGSAITYARRYALCGILGLEVEDDDGNEASKPKRNGPGVVIKDLEDVPENPKVTVHGADDSEDEPQIPEDVTDQKRVIMDLVKKLEPKTDMRSKKAIVQVVSDYTQLELIEQNYPLIIPALMEEWENKNR